jgi:GTPase SAR1 family protein
MTIDALITGLSKGLELSAEEIADTLWLALQIEESQPELSIEAELRENSPQLPLARVEPEVLPEISTHPSEPEEIASNQPPDEPKAGIYPRNPQEPLLGSGLSLRVPDAPSLREPLTLARALKPLMRRMPSGSTLVLDEAATTQQIAETGLWLPVLKPTLEPWLDLELVVDEGISMQIWRHTIGELERLLKNYGIFRDVRVWGLITDDSEALDLPHLVQIRRGIGATSKHRSPRSPAELIDPSGRRLILVVSDCVSPQWRDGKLTKTLELWAKQGSMAIVQMLPKWLWKRTALGRASEVRLQGLNPGEFNQKLIAKGVSLWDELEETRGVKVPIFTLEPDRVATWAQMLSGKGSTWTAGYVFKLDPLPAKQGKDLFALDIERQSPEHRVQAFRVTASPMARKLAGLLAASPVISLSIVRLIQETLLKESQQVHVAEVFLGGLLKPLSEINPEANPTYVQYEFIDGVRELLADSVPSGHRLDVVDAVSKYMARKVGLSLAEFAAVLRNPQQVTDGEMADNVSYFATMTAQVLRRLGGEYKKFAESLEGWSVWECNRQHGEQTDRIYEANLIIIGEGGAGKTTLAKKIQSSDYQLQDEDSTQGLDVIQWKFTFDNEKEFSVNIYDFGGQEIYHNTHQFFFTKRSLYILVVDTRKEDTDFYYWLNVVKLLSDNSPLLIVKNEKQDRQREINDRQLRGEFTNLKETIPTNLATNRGLPEIIKQIKHHICNLPHVGTVLPKTWVKVREALEQESRNYISLEEYIKLCEDNGFTRREDKLQLSRYLHDLGVCLHFQEDELLMKTVILNPTWAIDAVYKILDNLQVIKNQGRFTYDDLKQIWHEDKYATTQTELLRLMMNFKLCYEIPNVPKAYIAPQLLTPNRPDYDWHGSGNLLLRYEYDFMPKGIMTRFIVEMYAWIESQSCLWKSGVVLSKDGARAEVTELYRYHKGEIRIRVSGKRQRALLTSICYELNKIHDSYEKLKYRTLVPCQCSHCATYSHDHPWFYSLETLLELQANCQEIQCQLSFEMVNIRRLIDEIAHSSDLIQANQALEQTTSQGKPTSEAKSTRKTRQSDPATVIKISKNIVVLNNSRSTDKEKMGALRLLRREGNGNDRAIRPIVSLILRPKESVAVISKAIEVLSKIGKDHLSVVPAILRILIPSQTRDVIISAMQAFAKIAVDNSNVIQKMLSLLSSNNNDAYVQKAIIESLGEVAVRHKIAISRLLSILRSNQNTSTIKIAASQSLGKIASAEDRDVISYMEIALKTEKYISVKRSIAISLNKIDTGNEAAAEYRRAETRKTKIRRK